MIFRFHRHYTLSLTSLNRCLVLTTIKYIAHTLSSKFLPYEHVFRPKVRWRLMASRQTSRCCPTSWVTLRLSSRPTAYSSVQHHHTSVWQSDCQTTIPAKHRPHCDHEIQGLLCDTVECQTKGAQTKSLRSAKSYAAFCLGVPQSLMAFCQHTNTVTAVTIVAISVSTSVCDVVLNFVITIY